MITQNRKASSSFNSAPPGILASLLFLSTGCAVTPPQAPPQAAAPSVETIYVVQKGDTLDQIARHFTGDAQNASGLAQYNALRRQHRLNVGQRLVIPASMIRASSAVSRMETVAPAPSDAMPEVVADPPSASASAGLPANAAPVGAILGQVLMGGVWPPVLASGGTHRPLVQPAQRRAARAKAIPVAASGGFPQALAVEVVHQIVREGLRQAQEDDSAAPAPTAY